MNDSNGIKFKFSDSNETLKVMVVLTVLALIGAVSRLFPFGDNISAMGAVSFLAGYVIAKTSSFKLRTAAFLVPLCALFVSDYFIGFHSLMPTIYFAFIFSVFLGQILSSKQNYLTATMGSLTASIFFFIVSNLGVWFEGHLYPKTLDGLVNCFLLAIPFFKYQWLADLVLTLVIWSALTIFLKAKESIESVKTIS